MVGWWNGGGSADSGDQCWNSIGVKLGEQLGLALFNPQ